MMKYRTRVVCFIVLVFYSAFSLAMNKSELIDTVARDTGISKEEAAAAVESFLNTIENRLAHGDQVSLVGFGTFSVKERAARTGRNPQTGELIQIPAQNIPSFKAGKKLKNAVNSTFIKETNESLNKSIQPTVDASAD